MMNVRYPFFEINVGELTQDSRCIGYLDGCTIVNFTLMSPNHSEVLHYSFYHVSGDFNSLLPTFKNQVLGYPFVAGKISFNMEDLFYGPVFTAEINLQSNIPTIGSSKIQREKLELVNSYSYTTIQVFLKSVDDQQDMSQIFYTLNQNHELMLGILTRTGGLVKFSFLREPIEIYVDGLVLPQSAFSGEFRILVDGDRHWDYVVQLFDPNSFSTLYLVAFLDGVSPFLFYNLDGSHIYQEVFFDYKYSSSSCIKSIEDIDTRRTEFIMVIDSKIAEGIGGINIYNVAFGSMVSG